ncbi:MAG: hypothetical protein IIA73_08620 [Proteobacteria bacterium]|nr:hypothetical protein [Pseudomonadota bacterium]
MLSQSGSQLATTPERPRAPGPREARLSAEHRRPGAAAGVDRADQQERQCREELPMLLRHVIADHPAARLFDPVADARPGLDLYLAAVKWRSPVWHPPQQPYSSISDLKLA